MDLDRLQKGVLYQRFPCCDSGGGGSGGAVNTVFGRSGNVIAMVGDYTVSQITGAVSDARRVIAGAGLSGGGALTADVTLTANVTSVFGRIGPITAQPGDYTADKITNAVDSSSYYSDPTWLGISWSKVTGKPTTFPPSAHTHAASDIISGIMAAARLGSGAANNTTFLRGDGLWATPPTGGGSGQNQTPWLSDINADGHMLYGVTEIDASDSIWISDGNKPAPWVSLMNVGGRLDVNQGFRSASHCSIGTVDSTYSLNIYGDVNLTGGGQFLIDGVPFAGGVSTVFGRSGVVVAQSGDYTAAQVTNALSSLGTYADPTWLTALDWSKLLNKPTAFTPSAHTHVAADITSGVFATARLGTGTADNTTYLRGDGTWQTVSAGGSQTPWLQNVDADGYTLFDAGHIYFKVDATYDIGQTGALRPRYLYNAFDIYAGGYVSATNFLKSDAAGAIAYVNHAGGTVNGFYGLYWDKTNEILQLYTGGAPRWQVTAAGNFVATTDNAYDIGASATTRPKNIFLAGSMIAGGNVTVGLGNSFIVSTRSKLLSAADGNFTMQNNAGTGFTLLQFGGTGAGFPALRRATTSIEVVLADQSAYTTFASGSQTIFGIRPTILFDQGTTARSRVSQVQNLHRLDLSINTYFDGTNWQRDDTGNSSIIQQIVGSNVGGLNSVIWQYAAAGANPITFTTKFYLDMVNGKMGVNTSATSYRFGIGDTSRAYTDASSGLGALCVSAGAAGQTDESIVMGMSSGNYGWIQAVKPGTAARTLHLNPVGGSVCLCCPPNTSYAGDAILPNSSVTFMITEATNSLSIRVKYSTGTVKVASFAVA